MLMWRRFADLLAVAGSPLFPLSPSLPQRHLSCLRMCRYVRSVFVTGDLALACFNSAHANTAPRLCSAANVISGVMAHSAAS